MFANHHLLKYILLILVISTFAIGCNSEKQTPKNTILISGHIDKPNGTYLYFYTYTDTLSNYLGVKTKIDSTKILEDGKFELSVQATKPMVFDLACGDSGLVSNHFLLPGDHLKINFRGGKNRPEIIPTGEAGKFNDFLLMFADSFYHNPDSRREYYIVTNYMSLAEFTKYNENRHKAMLGFYEKYFTDFMVNKEYTDYALNTINYGIGVDRLMYLWKKRMKVENVRADSTFFKFADSSYLENNTGYNCPAYIRFLNLYIKDIYERRVEDGVLVVNAQNGLIPSVEKYKIALEKLHRPYCDIVIANIALTELNDVSDSQIKSQIPSISIDSLEHWIKVRYAIN